MSNIEDIKCELLVIGAGIAGFSASVFAANRNISVAQTGLIGEIIYSSSLIDLSGVNSSEPKNMQEDPWENIDRLRKDCPKHPYAIISNEDISSSLKELVLFLEESGLKYINNNNKNSFILTSIGTLKPTYYVPKTMWPLVDAFKENKKSLIVDIVGLREFNSRQITETIKDKWPALQNARIQFPNTENMSEVFPEHMARFFESYDIIDKIADQIKPHLADTKYVGMPAIFGYNNSEKIISELEKKLNVTIFEIPLPPPNITGQRIKKAFEKGLSKKGVINLTQKKVLNVIYQKDNTFVVELGNERIESKVKCNGIILSSGRFLGKGLHASRKKIKETIFNLYVHQPEKRSDWHSLNFNDPLGHQINSAGLLIDNEFRPLKADNKPAYDNLFAAGSILSHNDWKRLKCGSGVSISTAYSAVMSYLNYK